MFLFYFMIIIIIKIKINYLIIIIRDAKQYSEKNCIYLIINLINNLIL